jgi:hypothetical protein
MGVGISFYYGFAERLDKILTAEEYEEWMGSSNIDDNHVLNRLEKAGYETTSTEEWGPVLQVGTYLSGGDGYKNYCNNSLHKENWIERLLDSGLAEMKKEMIEHRDKINEIAGRKLIDKEPYFFSRG